MTENNLGWEPRESMGSCSNWGLIFRNARFRG
jgi:hypothetical protein